MKLTQHGTNLWQLTRFTAFNNYLVREDDGLTLIDTNMGGSQKAILAAAETIDLPITRIALTHAHGDHAGSLDEVAALLPEAEVAFAPRTAEFLQGNLELRPVEPQAKLRGGFVERSSTATQLLNPGDRLGSLRVVAAPGHTPDQIAFLDERDGTLIAGDAFQTAAGTAVAGIKRWLFPFPAMATWHLPTALATAVSLQNLNPTRLAVGHGRVLENPADEIAQAIHEAEAKVHAQAKMA
ncbi:MAG: MBL fold metallo-hydrolase [Candidatus Promineifilaceae bacterium]|nr:MBL fold metallo-hydrolase [Candidatus Promineifilaceae bacterium]